MTSNDQNSMESLDSEDLDAYNRDPEDFEDIQSCEDFGDEYYLGDIWLLTEACEDPGLCEEVIERQNPIYKEDEEFDVELLQKLIHYNTEGRGKTEDPLIEEKDYDDLFQEEDEEELFQGIYQMITDFGDPDIGRRGKIPFEKGAVKGTVNVKSVEGSTIPDEYFEEIELSRKTETLNNTLKSLSKIFEGVVEEDNENHHSPYKIKIGEPELNLLAKNLSDLLEKN